MPASMRLSYRVGPVRITTPENAAVGGTGT